MYLLVGWMQQLLCPLLLGDLYNDGIVTTAAPLHVTVAPILALTARAQASFCCDTVLHCRLSSAEK